MDPETYQADRRTRALSELYLHIAIEATLDLGRHVIVKSIQHLFHYLDRLEREDR